MRSLYFGCLLWLTAAFVPASVMAASAMQFPPVVELLQGRTPLTTGLQLNLPSVSEDGSAVPLELSFNGQLQPGDRLSAVHLLATGNPKPELMSLSLLSAQALPSLTSRVRLNESQTVIAVALSEQGQAWITSKEVRVTISGCLISGQAINPANASMENPRVALPRRLLPGKPIELRTLINHPMETGLRTDASGSLIPQNLVKYLQLEIDAQPVALVSFNNGTAANPYVRLAVQTEDAGAVTLRWQDQQGAEVVATRELTF